MNKLNETLYFSPDESRELQEAELVCESGFWWVRQEITHEWELVAEGTYDWSEWPGYQGFNYTVPAFSLSDILLNIENAVKVWGTRPIERTIAWVGAELKQKTNDEKHRWVAEFTPVPAWEIMLQQVVLMQYEQAKETILTAIREGKGKNAGN